MPYNQPLATTTTIEVNNQALMLVAEARDSMTNTHPKLAKDGEIHKVFPEEAKSSGGNHEREKE